MQSSALGYVALIGSAFCFGWAGSARHESPRRARNFALSATAFGLCGVHLLLTMSVSIRLALTAVTFALVLAGARSLHELREGAERAHVPVDRRSRARTAVPGRWVAGGDGDGSEWHADRAAANPWATRCPTTLDVDRTESDVRRFLDRLSALAPAAWLAIGMRAESDAAERATAIAVLEALLGYYDLRITAWYLRDQIETLAHTGAEHRVRTRHVARRVLAARRAAEAAALAALVRPVLAERDFEVLYRPFAPLIQMPARSGASR